jgi:hypothetical protein
MISTLRERAATEFGLVLTEIQMKYYGTTLQVFRLPTIYCSSDIVVHTFREDGNSPATYGIKDGVTVDVLKK